jgi:uncharacterized protein YprB with RNaseH-like and TPR domain
VIERTFQLVRGIGPWRERDLWARGFTDWAAFRADPGRSDLPSEQIDALGARIDQAEAALASRDLVTLASLLPPREHWRLYPTFVEQAVFLDIETDGQVNGRPTVVGLLDRLGLHVFVQGRNLGGLPAALARSPVWVTFNGRCFDVPVLRGHFPALPRPAVHLDLRFLCRRVGLRGGLKAIEQDLGIGRPPHLRGTGGWDAVLLWRNWLATGELESLRFLVEYNLYDAFQLRSVADAAFNLAVDDLAFEAERIRVWERGDVLYDVSRLLLALGPEASDAVARARWAGEAPGASLPQ